MGKKKKKKNNGSKQIKKKEVSREIYEPKKESYRWCYISIISIITLIFCGIYGVRILNPENVDWIFASTGLRVDIVQHYIGWEAFRLGNWSFPFVGLTNMLSYPFNISAIHTDCIPVLAVFFKLISFMLPKTFQYLGLYGLLCFILQGILAANIVKKFTDSKLNIVVSSILFSIIPSMIFRLFYHTALASQWLLLLSLETLFLYSDFQRGKKIYIMWGIISFLVSSIHIYYLLMCGIILVGYILLDILNTKKVWRSIILLIIYLLVAAFTIWIFGGFDGVSSHDTFGFGLFSYNLNGLVNSQGWSVFLKALPMKGEQYEGFSYLGLGVILLNIISIILIIMWYRKDKEDLKRYRNLFISLLVISFVCLFVSLSPKVYFGEHLLFELKLPEFINHLWGIFRSTGRFMWPVIHILMLSSVIIVLKRVRVKVAFVILLVCCLVQILDIGNVLSELHSFYSKEYSINDNYNLNTYDELKKVSGNKKIELLVFASDNFYNDDLMFYSDWALHHHMKTSKFRFARTSYDEIFKKNTKKFLKERNDKTVFLFTSKEECDNYQLHCYELPSDYAIGYVNEL